MSATRTQSREPIRQQLATLLGEFEHMKEQHGLKGQSEAQARTWIERFLSVFGWDPADPQQVVQEYSIHGREARRIRATGSSHSRPDYALMAHGQRVLYLDAKRFDVNLADNMNVSYQIRTYGWSAGLKLSYAFDFEELAIYDCRVKPDAGDEADVARVLYLHHTDYMASFDDLHDYFAREAIEDGSLERRHPSDKPPKGTKRLDELFEENLSMWRVELAKAIVRHGKVRDPKILSGAAQRILDRIIFIRFCEEIGLEEMGTLMHFSHADDGFWPLFVEETEKRWSKVYDGILFPHSEEDDPTGIEAHLRQWWLKGKIFKEIAQHLYFPQPYQFDVIPLELLGGIYERYLGKRLRVVGAQVSDEFKPEYQRTQGAVYTPTWVVQRVIARALDPLVARKSADEILRLKIVDPACGSGSFLLGVFSYLENAILSWCRRHPDSTEARRHAVKSEAGWRLSSTGARAIIDRCIYGVDIDPEAVEIARMSLALRFVERAALDEPEVSRDLLAGVGKNIKQGNSLLGAGFVGLGLDNKAIEEHRPFDWQSKRQGFGAVMEKGGFDAVVGNPPYIEVKRYREWLPELYRYLKDGGEYQTTAQGKTDIAMPFIERGVKVLRPGGRLAFIVQNRFFKTDYGSLTRKFLLQDGLLAEVEDFRDVQVFEGRTTYTAILSLHRGSKNFAYRTYDDVQQARRGEPVLQYEAPLSSLDDEVWSLDQPDLAELHARLCKRFGTLGSHRGVEIGVGLQTLWGKLYQFEAKEVKPRTVIGTNALGDTVTLERAALRPLCRNRGFYPFRQDNADAWVIFPYEIKDGQARELRFKEFSEKFPRTAHYLQQRKNELKKAVRVPEGADRWHLYTRPQNLVSQARPKVLFPSTIDDTVAAVDTEGLVYQDNVRMQSLAYVAGKVDLYAVAAVFNSSLFNALARMKAGLSDAGWRQINKQYISLVPFPLSNLCSLDSHDPLIVATLQIAKLQAQLLRAMGGATKGALSAALEREWQVLDDQVCRLYELDDKDRAIAARYPRRVDRVELLLRQAVASSDESAEAEDVDD